MKWEDSVINNVKKNRDRRWKRIIDEPKHLHLKLSYHKMMMMMMKENYIWM